MTDMTGLDLTRKLIAFNTISPPGNEADCAKFIAALLEPAGFEITWHDWQSRRPNLIATLPATEPVSRGGDCLFRPSGHRASGAGGVER